MLGKNQTRELIQPSEEKIPGNEENGQVRKLYGTLLKNRRKLSHFLVHLMVKLKKSSLKLH